MVRLKAIQMLGSFEERVASLVDHEQYIEYLIEDFLKLINISDSKAGLKLFKEIRDRIKIIKKECIFYFEFLVKEQRKFLKNRYVRKLQKNLEKNISVILRRLDGYIEKQTLLIQKELVILNDLDSLDLFDMDRKDVLRKVESLSRLVYYLRESLKEEDYYVVKEINELLGIDRYETFGVKNLLRKKERRLTKEIIVSDLNKLLSSRDVGNYLEFIRDLKDEGLLSIDKKSLEFIRDRKNELEREEMLEIEILRYSEQDAKKLLERDYLTGAYNRKAFDSFLSLFFEYFQNKKIKELILEKNHHVENTFSLVMIDIDRFKSINDKYGHQIGDLVLKYLGNIVRDNIRDYDLFCRYGGEEFAILFPGLNANLTSSIAERIRMGLEKTTISVGNYIFNVTASFGIEGCKDDIEDKDKILLHADIALFKAKNSGRNRIVIYSSDLGEKLE